MSRHIFDRLETTVMNLLNPASVIKSDDLDLEGVEVATSAERPTLAELEAILPLFTGAIEQVPPAFSALKVDGSAWDGQTSEADLRANAKSLFSGVEESFVTHGMVPTGKE